MSNFKTPPDPVRRIKKPRKKMQRSNENSKQITIGHCTTMKWLKLCFCYCIICFAIVMLFCGFIRLVLADVSTFPLHVSLSVCSRLQHREHIHMTPATESDRREKLTEDTDKSAKQRYKSYYEIRVLANRTLYCVFIDAPWDGLLTVCCGQCRTVKRRFRFPCRI